MIFDIDPIRELEDPVIAALDVSMFDRNDQINFILQRSEILWDIKRGGKVIRAWMAGDAGPIEDQADRLGSELARRAAAVIHAEYKAMKPTLARLPLGRVADIGCGYGFLDLFIARDFGSELLLIDLEQNEHRHFGYKGEGAAYSALGVARRMLEANGVPAGAIRCLNPRAEDVCDAGPVDLALSILSCGFHYPVTSYLPFFRKNIAQGGHILLDLREGSAAAQLGELAPLGQVEQLDSPQAKLQRILLRRDIGA